jgi:predicted Ser/Thr protein kinase
MPSAASLCPKCAGEVREGWRVCPACAAPLDGATQTLYSHVSVPGSSSTSADEGRFPAGTILAGRYRVLGILGKGGMGEVYKAYDLILNQSVALKFLTAARLNEAALARFRNEVRIARQVSHPNVCRVYDIGFVDGLHFLSMEYLDGEDLSSLLRRIGRLPQDKAMEFTRKICAGLSAAHERGVLHRDLKPGNIMIDGRGHVRITDFGLAALAEEIALGDVRSGTPAYMSPEQKAGKEVTTRSDLYSLGLVIHEMFTGKPRTSTGSSASEIVKDLDPAIERIIGRCLEEDPRRRPATALNVAMALPGGDPIAAALAAGETPLPEMVAASQEKEGISARAAIACFAGVLVSLVVVGSVISQWNLAHHAPIGIPAQVLAFQAQQMLKQFGYGESPRDTAYGFDCCNDANLDFVNRFEPARRDELLRTHQPPTIRFWYRQNQRDRFLAEEIFDNTLPNGMIAYDSPANAEPGMLRMAMDPTGRLTELEVRPDARGQRVEGSPRTEPDWSELFKAAGLDMTRFTAEESKQTPPIAFDARMAWVGTYSNGLENKLHVEAAYWQGRPVYFSIRGDWVPEEQTPTNVSAVLSGVAALMFFGVCAGAVLIARNNLRAGRGDRRGAAIVAGAAFLFDMLAWGLRAAHVASYWEIHMLISAICESGFVAGGLWLAYLAIEPYIRRNWPDGLISWNRLQAGRLRDPLVASHILVGIFAWLAIIQGFAWSLRLLGSLPVGPPGAPELQSLTGPAVLAGNLLGEVQPAVLITIVFLLLVVLTRLLLRKVWIADVVGSVLFGMTLLPRGAPPSVIAVLVAVYALLMYALLWVFRRFGFLALLAAWLTWGLLNPVLPSFTDWYAGGFLVSVGITVALAGAALWVILSAQRQPEAT